MFIKRNSTEGEVGMKVAIVTGASSGMGKEFSREIAHFYKHLDEVWIVARRAERLKVLADRIEKRTGTLVRVFDGDLAKDSVYEKMKEELLRRRPDLRILVNCAGFGKTGRVQEIDAGEQLGIIDVNCRALTRMTLLCLPYLSGGSRIINAASAAAFAPQPGFAVYAASKAYVKSFSYALGEEMKERGIYVTAVCPGPVDTEFFLRSGELPGEGRQLRRSDVKPVVRKALLDSAAKRQISVYGAPMKAARIFAKLLPDAAVAAVMKQVNHI